MFYFTETNEPVTENTVYGIGSVSKHFTTTLLGQTLRNAGIKVFSLSFEFFLNYQQHISVTHFFLFPLFYLL